MAGHPNKKIEKHLALIKRENVSVAKGAGEGKKVQLLKVAGTNAQQAGI